MADQMFKCTAEKITAGKDNMEFWNGMGSVIL